jgi:plastocyanin
MSYSKFCFPAFSAALIASVAHAATFNVTTAGNSFTPKNLNITVGDTVTWTWPAAGFHNVTSGLGGAPDGHFTSGSPVFGGTLSVTFTQAFLDAHPVQGNLYNYFCDVHVSFGMEGAIRVNAPPVGPTAYGCGVNPPGSLALSAGALKLGTAATFAVHNPLGSMPPGALSFLAISAGSAPGFPCGFALPNFGLSAPGAVGELLLNITPGILLPTIGPVIWTGTPSSLNVSIPNNLTLLGTRFFFQGAMYNIGNGHLGLTNALQGQIGNL